jgi:FixJ family two-component response regulator
MITVMATCHGRQGDESGAVDFIEKPVDPTN